MLFDEKTFLDPVAESNDFVTSLLLESNCNVMSLHFELSNE